MLGDEAGKVKTVEQSGLAFLLVALGVRTLQSSCDLSGMLGAFLDQQKKMAATCKSKQALPSCFCAGGLLGSGAFGED